MDKSGKTFFAGLAVAQAPSEVNDVESLISGYFNKAAAKATSHLPPPEKVKRKGAPKN